ncbi:MAG: TrmH family RNA methyltransferase [Desertimonas sp.]
MPDGPAGLAASNPNIQRLRRLQGRRSARRECGTFVVEGPTLIAEALAAGWEVRGQYHAPGVEPLDGPPAHVLQPGVAEKISDTETPTGLLAEVTMRSSPIDSLAVASFVVVAAGISDPGNLGTIMRSAEAAGVDAVVLTPGTVDPFNPKVVRSSAGALFHVPVIEASLDDVRLAGLRLIGTSSHHGVAHDRADWSGRIALVAGNEAHGLPDDAPVDEWVRIDHAGRAESLNVAMATTVVVFAALSARR